ncbi:MAG: hypothetical protein ACQEP7_02985 [bacterium]
MSDKDSDSGAPRFRQKPLEVTLYKSREDVNYTPAFEGQTSSVSRMGVGVRVDGTGQFKSIDPEELEGDHFIIQFHTGHRELPTVRGKCTMVGRSEDMRYKHYLGFEFEEELALQELFS